jgi:hypothetical protein
MNDVGLEGIDDGQPSDQPPVLKILTEEHSAVCHAGRSEKNAIPKREPVFILNLPSMLCTTKS